MRLILASAALLASVALAAAQDTPKKGDASKDLTNCSPNSTSGVSSSDAQAVEKSAILPSAEGHEKSAAPTVQREGQSVEARADCPQDAKQPKPKG